MTPSAQLGKYSLLSKIADGGMAEVFLAETGGVDGFQKRVALKLILPHFTQDRAFVEGFVNEARICGQLQHPNVVQVYEFQQLNERYYLAMEFIEGLDLERIISHRYITRESIPHPLAVEVVVQMLEGLEYAHTATDMDDHPLNIVHRDLKPSNILIDLHGVIKIVDFGVAKSSSNLYKTLNAGTAKGTVSYMSPEQASGRMDLGPQSDLFSVGEILYELLTLIRLFDGDNLFAILDAVRSAPLDDRIEAIPNVSPELKRVVHRALTRDLDQRYGSCLEMIRDLRAIYPDQQGGAKLARFVECLRTEGLKVPGVDGEAAATNPPGYDEKRASRAVLMPPTSPPSVDLAQELAGVGAVDVEPAKGPGIESALDEAGVGWAHDSVDRAPPPAEPLQSGSSPAPGSVLDSLAAGSEEITEWSRVRQVDSAGEVSSSDETAAAPAPVSAAEEQTVNRQAPAVIQESNPEPLRFGEPSAQTGLETRILSQIEPGAPQRSPAVKPAESIAPLLPRKGSDTGQIPEDGEGLPSFETRRKRARDPRAQAPTVEMPASQVAELKRLAMQTSQHNLEGSQHSESRGPIQLGPSAGASSQLQTHRPSPPLKPTGDGSSRLEGMGPASGQGDPVWEASPGEGWPAPETPVGLGGTTDLPPMPADQKHDGFGEELLDLSGKFAAVDLDPLEETNWQSPEAPLSEWEEDPKEVVLEEHAANLPESVSPAEVVSLFDQSQSWEDENRAFGERLEAVERIQADPVAAKKKRQAVVGQLAAVSGIILVAVILAGLWTVFGMQPSIPDLLFPPEPQQISIRFKHLPSWGEPKFFGDPPPVKGEDGHYRVMLSKAAAYRIQIVGNRFESAESHLIIIDPADPNTWVVSEEFSKRGRLR